MARLIVTARRDSEGIYAVNTEDGERVGVVFPYLRSRAPKWGYLRVGGKAPGGLTEGEMQTFGSRKAAVAALAKELDL